MEDIINNGWVIGVGGGVLSGLIVAWLTRTLFSKKDLRELAGKISSANKEILYAIRPEISEDNLPSTNVIEALRNATARRYKIEAKHLYNITEIAEEPIKEIMDSSFISSSLKKKYCDSLNEIILDELNASLSIYMDSDALVERIEYKERMTSLLSLTLGTIAALATAISFLRSSFDSLSPFGKITESIFPMALVMTSVMIVMAATQVALKLNRKKAKEKDAVEEPSSCLKGSD